MLADTLIISLIVGFLFGTLSGIVVYLIQDHEEKKSIMERLSKLEKRVDRDNQHEPS